MKLKNTWTLEAVKVHSFIQGSVNSTDEIAAVDDACGYWVAASRTAYSCALRVLTYIPVLHEEE